MVLCFGKKAYNINYVRIYFREEFDDDIPKYG